MRQVRKHAIYNGCLPTHAPSHAHTLARTHLPPFLVARVPTAPHRTMSPSAYSYSRFFVTESVHVTRDLLQEGEDSASEEEGGDQEQDDDFFTIRGANKGGKSGGGGVGASDSEDDDGDGDKAVCGGDRSKFSPDLEALEDWEETGEDCAIEALRNK